MKTPPPAAGYRLGNTEIIPRISIVFHIYFSGLFRIDKSFTRFVSVVMIKTDTGSTISQKAGDYMPSGIEATKQALDDFAKVQRYMLLAREEGAAKTYESLKKEYLILKALLQVSGVNLTDIDEIKE